LIAHIAALANNKKNVDSDFVWGKMAAFLVSFDPRQIRYLGQEFIKITEAVAILARRGRLVLSTPATSML
jgi:COP9 signalosome complex subunit 3